MNIGAWTMVIVWGLIALGVFLMITYIKAVIGLFYTLLREFKRDKKEDSCEGKHLCGTGK